MKYDIQSSNINFLFGSGLSMPFLQTLGSVEQRLTELERATDISETARKIILASIRKAYFDMSIAANSKVLIKDPSCANVLNDYTHWLTSLNQILVNRKSTLLNKQINLFTTNMDVFPEITLESLELEYNDGFYGTIFPKFELSNFRKSIFKTSQQYSVATEVPTFNVYKLHGSVNWKMDGSNITYDHNLENTKAIDSLTINTNYLINPFIAGSFDFAPLATLVALAKTIRSAKEAEKFNALYEKLVIVNPTKEKFKLTTLNQTYYELLRMYSNELEKESTVLFVMGFSFADEHLSEITLRAARSNPTLKIFIYAYDAAAETQIKNNLKIIAGSPKHANIQFVPRMPIKDDAGNITGEYPHTLNNINVKDFSQLARETNDRK